MKIVFVTSRSLSRHATIKRAWGMAPHLIQRGISTTVVCEDCEENRVTAAAVPGMDALYYPAGLSMRAERAAKASLVRRARGDVVHLCGLGWRNAVRRSVGRGRFVMDHVELESAIAGTSRLRRLLQAGLERWSFDYYDGTVAASRYLEFAVRRHQLTRSRARPVLWLPFAFDEDSLRPEAARLEAFRNEAGGRVTIAYMGGLYRNYGVHDLVEAYRSSPSLARNARLVFVGRGPEADYLRRQSCHSAVGPQISFAGFLDERSLASFLFASDVLVSPLADTVQDWARCPSKTYMYMATRRPIVTPAVGENREALGDLGFYYTPGDGASLAGALERAAAVRAPVPYDLAAHTWSHRTAHYLGWLRASFGFEPDCGVTLNAQEPAEAFAQ